MCKSLVRRWPCTTTHRGSLGPTACSCPFGFWWSCTRPASLRTLFFHRSGARWWCKQTEPGRMRVGHGTSQQQRQTQDTDTYTDTYTDTDTDTYTGSHTPPTHHVQIQGVAYIHPWEVNNLTDTQIADTFGGSFFYYPRGVKSAPERLAPRPGAAILLDGSKCVHGTDRFLPPGSQDTPMLNKSVAPPPLLLSVQW